MAKKKCVFNMTGEEVTMGDDGDDEDEEEEKKKGRQ